MFHFQGIAQILSKVSTETSTNKYRNDTFEVLCSRGGTVPYSGDPFDIYRLTINYTDQQLMLFEKLKPGILIWVDSGNVFSTYKRLSNGAEFWNARLSANIDNVHILGRQNLGPSHADHVRLSINSKRYP